MSRESRGFQTFTLKLDDGLRGERLSVAGHTFQVLHLNPSVSVTMDVDYESDRSLELSRRMGWTHDPFHDLIFSAPAAAGETLKIVVGGDPAKADPRFFEFYPADTSSAVEVSNTAANPVPVSLADGAEVAVLEAGFEARAERVEPGQAVYANAIASGAGEDTVYTVPAGKRLVITAGVWAHADNTGSASATLSLREAGGVYIQNAAMTGTNMLPVPVLAGVVLTAGQRVTIGAGGTPRAYLSIQGYLEDE